MFFERYIIHPLLPFRMPVPELPKNQDCHELWSKKRRRQMREQQQMQHKEQQQQQHMQPPADNQHQQQQQQIVLGDPASGSKPSTVSQPNSDKMNEDSQG